MELFVEGKLNAHSFEMELRQATHDLADVLLSAARSQSDCLESTHFLTVLSRVANGVTQKKLSRLGITVDQWETGLVSCANRSANGLPPAHLTEVALHKSAASMFEEVVNRCEQYKLFRISEPVLLVAALGHLTAEARQLFESADIDVASWREEIETSLQPVVPVTVFSDQMPGAETGAASAQLLMDSFLPGARKVLALLRSEAESLGYAVADPRHLLLALLERDGGVSQYGVFHQGITPRKVQEAVMLSLRGRAKRTRSVLLLDREHLQPILQRILSLSGELAGRDHSPRVNEPHLLRAFLAIDSSARRILEDEKVRTADLRDIAESYDPGVEEEEDDSVIADIATVRERLDRRVVGQGDAIDRILPYIQRMRFGFTTPGRPVGVFLFCGQSGSGKTEMAKELARAVYGSEENLIFLEMGQFNSPESMNIFVGAPPGYTGYGDGKLTNGLRDKPCAVVLFDEVEKAHPKVLDALLRFLDEGRIDDPAGQVRDGTQCIVILTSNVGADEIGRMWSEVEGNPNARTIIRKKLREEFKRHNFRIEFLNRVDEVILFHTLTKHNYAEIARRLLKRDLERLLKERQIEVSPDPSVAGEIGDYCSEISEGARAAQRLTQSVVITPVIDFVLRNTCAPPVRLKVTAVRTSKDADSEPAGLVEVLE